MATAEFSKFTDILSATLSHEPPGWGAIRWAGMERWLRVVCLPALGGPMGTKATLLLLPAPQKWSFCILLLIIVSTVHAGSYC